MVHIAIQGDSDVVHPRVGGARGRIPRVLDPTPGRKGEVAPELKEEREGEGNRTRNSQCGSLT